MKSFTIALADIPIRITPVNSDVMAFFNDYLTQDSPLLDIIMSEKDIEFERKKDMTDYKNKKKHRVYSDQYLEILAILRKIATVLPDYDCFLFHGTAVTYKDKAYLFAAPSGVGKTTHALKWIQILPDSYILNGDKPFIRIDKERVLICGGPWRGKERYGCNETKPLEAICIIEQNEKNTISTLSLEEAFTTLMKQSHLPQDNLYKTVRLIEEMGKRVNLYKLCCNLEDESALLSIRTMIRDEI